MALPHPQSPQRSLSGDHPDGGLSALPQKEFFCTPLPLLSSASPNPFYIPTAMTTALQEPMHSDEDQPNAANGLLALRDQSALQWPGAYDLGYAHTNDLGAFRTDHSPMSAQYLQGTEAAFQYRINGLPYSNNYSLSYPMLGLEQASCPRSYSSGLGIFNHSDNGSTTESYPPSAYVINPPTTHETIDSQGHPPSSQFSLFTPETSTGSSPNIKLEDYPYSFYSDSPYGSEAGTRCSTPYSETPMTPIMKPGEYPENTTVDKEQPYAQLIYRALMEAPGHTMVLRDIYKWFIKNTNKADNTETKGWQNSIRHNLSMNGAFEKVDIPGEDSRKGFMWRLTDEAIREGVKSTTRYRSKQPHKRQQRTSNPLPQRVASGSRGGHASRRASRLRRSQRESHYRPDPYTMCRSVPVGYDGSYNAPVVLDQYPLSPLGYGYSAPGNVPLAPGSANLQYHAHNPTSNPPTSLDCWDSAPSSSNSSVVGLNSPLIGSAALNAAAYPSTPYATSTYAASPLSLPYDTAAYSLRPQDDEPLFYPNPTGVDSPTPSPPASEPRTPEWDGGMCMGGGAEPYLFEDVSERYEE
ncbi:hypothetical protein M011DRAFT_348779 [Sporormia fimetaria CBS 119925]|uniref:Fork-head domain-containing protein n=1 Tax=Sporormia fimetaria CBS 119925 TaxID=1340428 RepID=A0A6A6VCZ3_9PLEO|nr:hypothetical protein M011DRAFT_348779 [Sporormia fimetaria CBS 119925]